MEENNEYCEKHCKGYRDTGGRCFADGRCDAYWEYQKQKGTMKKFNQDYKITISGDMNGNAYWGLLRKGEPAACNEEEIRMVAQVFGELKEKIDKQYPPNGKV